MTNESDVSEPEQPPRGLYSGFERYATPTDADYRSVMTSGLVVLDTNALLNLYRYTPRVRTALLDILAKVGDQLWQPDQVMLEFWRNRESAIRDYGKAARDFEGSVKAARDATTKAIREIGNRIGLGEDHKRSLIGPIDGAFAELLKAVDVTMGGNAAEPRRDTGADPVLSSLDGLLRGRVGQAPDPEARQRALAEAKRRIEAKVPPGFKDNSKSDEQAAGDYLVWRQLLDEAASRCADALLVTGDVKEDWWRRWGGIASAGPRLELLDEFHAEVGRRIYLLQPADFLVLGARIYGVTIPAESVAQVRQVDAHRGMAPRRHGMDYERTVARAVASNARQMALVDTEYLGPPDAAIDLELRDANESVAVVIKYAISPLSWEWLQRTVESVISVGYGRLLLISNEKIRQSDARRLSTYPILSRFVRWTGSDDDVELIAAIDYLFPTDQDGAA